MAMRQLLRKAASILTRNRSIPSFAATRRPQVSPLTGAPEPRSLFTSSSRPKALGLRFGSPVNHPSFVRSYYVDRHGVKHFRKPGPSFNFQSLFSQRNLIILGAIGSLGTFYYVNHLEVVPYTNRKHLVLIPTQVENMLGETTFNNMKRQFKNRILPSNHPAVIRVRSIADKSIKAAMEGVRAGGRKHLEYAPDIAAHLPEPSTSRGYGFFTGSGKDDTPKYIMNLADKKLYREEETMPDDVWVEKSRQQGSGRKTQTGHVDRFNWEIVVIDAPTINAACLPGGKIIVFTGLLKHFHTDDEIAAIIGHEIGHALARHTGEMLTRSIFIGFVEVLMLAVVQAPSIVGPVSDLLLRFPFSRKMEIEADHIGVLVMAASGFNPRVAPAVHLKLGQFQKIPEFVHYMSTHPSGKSRAEGLLKSQTLRDAEKIYESKRGGWTGFLI